MNRQTAARIEDIYEDYRRRGWNYQQYIACLPPMGQALSDSAYVLSPEAYGDFLIRLFHLWYRDWKKNRQPHIRQFENWIGMLAGYPPEACDQHGTCGIQSRFRPPRSACSASRIRSAMRLKASSKALHARGKKVVMLTGDDERTAAAVAARLGIDAGALRCFRPTRPTKSCVSRTREGRCSRKGRK